MDSNDVHSKRYKIGAVSKMFGLSNDAIRFYESKGIITPLRDEFSGYRYYDAWDLNYLLDCLRFRGFDFSTNEIEHMLHEDDCDEIIRRSRQREHELLARINAEQQKLKQLSHMRQAISRISGDLGTFNIEESPEMLWLCQRNSNEDESADTEKDTDPNAVSEWVKFMPFLEHTFKMPDRKSEGFSDYCWGFSISPSQHDLLRMPTSDEVVYIPSVKSVNSIFSAADEGTFIPSLQSQVIEPIKAQGHKIAGPPVGNLLIRVHEDGKMKRYFEVWVPID